MINYETILSNYDDKLTLMQWLKKVETALAAAALASVTITQPTEDTAVFNFEFADGTSVASPSLTLPRGPQGEQGEQGAQGVQGVGVSNVAINSNSHLIVTLTNGVEIDAGYIETGSGVVVDTELSPTSTNPVENRVIYNAVTANANNITALGGRVTTAEGDITALGGRMTTAEGDLTALERRVSAAEGDIVTLQNDKLEEVTAGDVDSEAATSGQVLTANGSGGASWQTPQTPQGGVTSIGGATGAITLGNGLTISNNELSASGGSGGYSGFNVAYQNSNDPVYLIDINGNITQPTALQSYANIMAISYREPTIISGTFVKLQGSFIRNGVATSNNQIALLCSNVSVDSGSND